MDYNIKYTLDYELEDNFNKLNEYIINSDYFLLMDKELNQKYKLRTDGIKKTHKIGETGINILEASARKVVNTKNKEYDIKCPLCINLQVDKNIYPYNLEKSLLWRGLIIKPNTFPYFKLHYLIQSSDHISNDRGTQKDVHINPNIIEDILQFIKIIKKGTILFNGYIGNSLEHLHFHYTDSHLPIKTTKKKYLLNKKIINTNNGSIIYFYQDNENNCKNFILIKGLNVSSDVFKFIKYINSINLLYNLICYYDSSNFYVFIYIRKKEIDDYNFNFGAAHMSGLGTFSDENLKLYEKNKEFFIKIIENYCEKTLIKIDIKLIESLFT
jgi:hypothetical protein